MNLFTVDNDNEIVWDVEQYKAIPSLLKIIKKDKLTASQELRYIWYIYNFNSPGNRAGFKGVQLENEAKHFAELKLAWIPNDDVLKAISDCQKFYGGVSVKYARTLLNALSDSKEVLEHIRKRASANLEELEMKDTSSKEEKAEARAIVKEVIQDINEIIGLADKLPRAIAVTEKAVDEALREIGEKSNDVWGGRSLGNREG